MKIYLGPELTGRPVAERLEIAEEDKGLVQAALRAAMDEAGRAVAALTVLSEVHETLFDQGRNENECRVASYMQAITCMDTNVDAPTTFTPESEVPVQVVYEGIMAGIGQMAQGADSAALVGQMFARLEYQSIQ